jgi:hypothetical protein
MSLGDVSQISEGIYAYLQPDGSWYLNNTGFLVSEATIAGDLLFNGGTPFALMGSISGWIEVLETVLGPLGAPLDLASALGDMVAYNGGRPLTCHA